MKNKILNNIENYNIIIEQNEYVLFLKYIGLIHELIENATDHLTIQKEIYLKYVLINAIKNTCYIYNILLLYTKNLELTIYHTQKSILYYIEFIGQIGDNNHSFLKLNSKDAKLFTYKKTIFNVNEEYRKEFEESKETKEKLKNLGLFINIYNCIINQYIEYADFDENFLPNLQKIVFTKLYKIVESLIQFKLKDNNFEIKINNVLNIIELFNKNYEKIFVKKNYLHIIDFIIKKINKKSISIENIKNKIDKDNISEKLKDFSTCKIINYLIS